MGTVTAALLMASLIAAARVTAESVCSTQTAVNGDTGKFIQVINNAESADACAKQCIATAGCQVFKFCQSQDACKNYWSRGGPDDPYMSCTLFTGPFKASPPNDWTVGGFVVGTCTGSGSGAPGAGGGGGAALPADVATKNLKGNVIQTSIAASAAECAAQCAGKTNCNGYNFCNADSCNGAVRGVCDLKQFDGPAAYWGDQSAVPGDGWVSGGLKVSNSAPSQQAANFGGNVIVLDYNSMTYSGGPNHPGSRATTPEECANACRANDKCNTWVFCAGSADAGCGAGCSRPANEYDSKNPSDSTRFGMFGGCLCPGSNDPGRTDCLWPKNMCSLKYNAGQPPVYSTGADGWISGVISKRR